MSASKKGLKSDFAKVDAHKITAAEYDEAPELTDQEFERADMHVGGILVRRGRKKSPHAKKLVSIRFDPDVIAHFKSQGAGWQSAMNQALRKVARLPLRGVAGVSKQPKSATRISKAAARKGSRA
jgi:uncharacterized protein (DUF4415 family)